MDCGWRAPGGIALGPRVAWSGLHAVWVNISGGTLEALVSAGWTVYGNDHRGHGRTAPSAAHLGDFGEGGFDLLVADMFRLSRIAREENPGQPMGHSMGPSPHSNTSFVRPALNLILLRAGLLN
jgi:Serine aminopeptidase, S33